MASLPLFYHNQPLSNNAIVQLDEDNAKHIVQVLRMQVGDALRITNGNGDVADAVITDAAKKRCAVTLSKVTHHEPAKHKLHLAVAFTKNTSRNEWLLEKATELGASSIIPLMATRSEKERMRAERWTGILVSAMMQSQQYYLPVLAAPTKFADVLSQYKDVAQKLVGHCIEEVPRTPLKKAMQPAKETIVLIGPEGDFTPEEVTLCSENGFVGITMASQRLRTETAAMNVCAYFNTINNEAN
eukprot:TRINITY_DN58873_c0_g1_i1.p1 TRINITY_DN58873_c0_g1~~TRINITY_DN58873_c0_g1_i1.p1  ORF type:complete len:243 (-),score=34.30 TRINITY_DN58873_c0_g1_i1:87-815(-)